MYEVAKAVADTPSLIAEFDMGPEAAAKKINAFQVTPGRNAITRAVALTCEHSVPP